MSTDKSQNAAPVHSVCSHAITGQWLRKIGFTYHAIGKYYYMSTINEILLVRSHDSETDPECRWSLSAVAGHIDPADYTDLEATLTGRPTRQDVTDVVRICEKERECV